MKPTPPPPINRDPPDFTERKAGEPGKAKPRSLARTPTEEISLDDIRRTLKSRAATRWPKLIIQVAAALTALMIACTGLWKAISANLKSDANSLLDTYKAEQDRRTNDELKGEVRDLREKYDTLREKIERQGYRLQSCCTSRER